MIPEDPFEIDSDVLDGLDPTSKDEGSPEFFALSFVVAVVSYSVLALWLNILSGPIALVGGFLVAFAFLLSRERAARTETLIQLLEDWKATGQIARSKS